MPDFSSEFPLGNKRFGSVSERLNYVFRFSQVWGLVQYHRDPRCHLKQWNSMKNKSKSLIFKDFRGFHDIHWADHDGSMVWTKPKTWKRNSNFLKHFRNVRFRGEKVAVAVRHDLPSWSAQWISWNPKKSLKINEINENQWNLWFCWSSTEPWLCQTSKIWSSENFRKKIARHGFFLSGKSIPNVCNDAMGGTAHG